MYDTLRVSIKGLVLDIKVDFESLKHGELNIDYNELDFAKTHKYSVPLDFFISCESLVALAIACRPKPITHVSFSFPISENAKKLLSRDYKITTESEVVPENTLFGATPLLGQIPSRARTFLSFSGGVDSLAARYLVGQDAEILSIDYGSRFEREIDFFKKWQPVVIKTNFRDKPFQEKIDWRFMSAGALLMSDYLGIETVLFGTILEAAPFWFNTIYRSVFEDTTHYQSFALSRVNSGQAVTSLSEYGTTKVAHCYGTEILEASIKSAADEKTSKKLRKLLLGKIITGDEITDEWALHNGPPVIPLSGKSFSEDVLGLYFAWRLGCDFTDKHILQMDEEFRDFAQQVDMAFFEKYNQFNLSSTPTKLKHKFVKAFEKIGIEPYQDRDIEALQKVRIFLSGRFNFKP